MCEIAVGKHINAICFIKVLQCNSLVLLFLYEVCVNFCENTSSIRHTHSVQP